MKLLDYINAGAKRQESKFIYSKNELRKNVEQSNPDEVRLPGGAAQQVDITPDLDSATGNTP